MAKHSTDPKSNTIFCRVSINDDQKWIHGIITYVNLDKRVAEIFLPARYFKEYLVEGSKITIKSMDQNNEILFCGSVLSKVISIRKQAITIQIDKVLNFANNRKYERFNVNYECLLVTQTGDQFAGKLMDISLNGCMIFSNEPIEENSVVTIKSFISSEVELNFQANVVRRKDLKNHAYSYGLQMSNIDNSNNITLNELIAYLINQKKHIEHEWKIFNRLKYTVYTITALLIFFIVFYVFASTVG
ncbi:PilZ domain-containing protein [Acetivibrio cellulolyticus]|uniref:PilZ domain-containing protein n=1 Tax=Acetivibrio cellulolyticus TaxID=35830 RepID=UPI0001E2F139|nr:PilZ domain-containing protein [Acetivibrio cellulolyticus]